MSPVDVRFEIHPSHLGVGTVKNAKPSAHARTPPKREGDLRDKAQENAFPVSPAVQLHSHLHVSPHTKMGAKSEAGGIPHLLLFPLPRTKWLCSLPCGWELITVAVFQLFPLFSRILPVCLRSRLSEEEGRVPGQKGRAYRHR